MSKKDMLGIGAILVFVVAVMMVVFSLQASEIEAQPESENYTLEYHIIDVAGYSPLSELGTCQNCSWVCFVAQDTGRTNMNDVSLDCHPVVPSN